MMYPSDAPKFVLAVVIAIALTLAAQAEATEPVHLEFLPEPVTLEVDGVSWVAFTFEQFLELARLDVRLQASLQREEVLRLTTEEMWEAWGVMEERLRDAVAQSHRLGELYAEAEAAHLLALDQLESCRERNQRVALWHPVYTPLVAVLLAALGLVVR